MSTSEANFDGLVGPTHNYAGLSFGNLASTQHGGSAANPRAAALQGLSKMKALMELGLVQGVLPPQERPSVGLLRRLGVSGRDDATVLERAAALDPTLLAIACSASAMWTANAATVAPSADTSDGRTHFVVANLQRKLHRAIEPPATFAALSAIFADRARFCVHPPLPAAEALGDEGAANHTRLASAPNALGMHLFVYGRRGLSGDGPAPTRFPARQTLEASQAVARLLRLLPDRCVFLQQNPEVVDAGVFHNDVIAVGHGRTLLHHEDAFLDPEEAFATLDDALEGLQRVVVPRAAVPVEDAVRSYLFNSQLLQLPGREGLVLIAPIECERTPSVAGWIAEHIGQGQPIEEARFFDLRESMQNGGGPACLRLRVVLGSAERAAANPKAFLTAERHAALVEWVERRYRDRLTSADLADPKLLDESRVALDELTQLLGLGSLYEFQKPGGSGE